MRKGMVVVLLLIAGGAMVMAIVLSSGKRRTSSYAYTLKNDKDSEKRAKAAKALGEMGPAARDAVPVLLAALKDDGRYFGPGFLVWRNEMYVHDEAAKALVKIGGPEAVEGLGRLLSDSYYVVASRAAKVLRELGPNAKAAIPLILITLDQSNQGEVLRASLEGRK